MKSKDAKSERVRKREKERIKANTRTFDLNAIYKFGTR